MSGDGRKESEVYSDDLVRITSTRVVIGGVTYALRNITSVRAYREAQYPAMVVVAVFTLAGVMFLYLSLVAYVILIVPAAVLLAFAFYIHRISPPIWHVGIRTSSGEVSALQLRDPQRIYLIADKISDALANY